MRITLKITEDSKVELVKDNGELVQGECCFTDFVFEFPATIKGYSISEYAKTIEFAECKEFGECQKFIDEINGDEYELDEKCTAYKKIKAQIVLTRVVDGKKITWKTVPFILEFHESINAENSEIVQSALLSLLDVKDEWIRDLDAVKDEWANELTEKQNDWDAFLQANCIYVVKDAVNFPTANAANVGKVVFYMGEEATSPRELLYGNYYHCVFVDGAYSWDLLPPDASALSNIEVDDTLLGV